MNSCSSIDNVLAHMNGEKLLSDFTSGELLRIPLDYLLKHAKSFELLDARVVPAGVPLVMVDKTGLEHGRPLIADCHAPPSHPAANITFFVNDEKKLETPAIEKAAAIMLNDHIQPNENNNVDMELNKLKQAVETVKKEILKPDKIKRKSWMTTEILNLIEERRQNKGNPTENKRVP
ncbi:unnamed protein product [Ceutorhynchus assimilis]|uniref:Uncharacterized protein n=1 Tax=Ceutorhynchus assimilis TaxID=467358 RepID=A0A9N9QM61_9CUCU|nr:unnamed protein product [Ceutorhynchus assimilis]